MPTTLFRDWIKTQDPSRWNNVDPISVEYIKQYFADRTICSEKSMERLFWLHVSLYEDTYNNMLRLQGANDTFDPCVSRYVETLRETTNSGTTTGSTKRNASRTGKRQDTTVYSAPETVTRSYDHTEDQYSDTDTLTMNDRKRDTKRNGTRKLTTHGDAEKNYTSDAPGSYDETTHKVDTSTSTKRSGKLVTTDQGKSALRNTAAEKAAPMTAVNLQREAGQTGPIGADDAYATVANGQLGPQDWTSASAYRETGQDQGDSRRREEYYEGDDTTVSTEGQSQNNTDRTTYGRNQRTGTDITDTETYDGYGETVTDTGSESRSRQIGPRHAADTETVTTTKSPMTVSDTESGQTEESGSNTQTQSGQSEDWYRHTGRDNLTPQQALAEGLKYLADYPDAILWFIRMLEPCVIGVLDIDMED